MSFLLIMLKIKYLFMEKNVCFYDSDDIWYLF